MDMRHIEIEAEEARQADLASSVHDRAIEIRKERAQAAMDSLRRRSPVVDDTINRPAHYAKQGDIECIDVLEQLAEDGHDFRILNAMKYLWRYRHKGGHESLQKARWYIERALEFPKDG